MFQTIWREKNTLSEEVKAKNTKRKNNMESYNNYSKQKEEEEEIMEEPVSPTGLYFNSSALSVSILAVLELETPLDVSLAKDLLQNVFLPINPRFASIMVRDDNGNKKWKKVEVNLKDHLRIPIFPQGLTSKSYDEYFGNYLSKISLEQFPENRPLWNVHIIKYPTTTRTNNDDNTKKNVLIFRLHHALGDGYSLMGALLSCLQRADNPSLPLTLPPFRRRRSSKSEEKEGGGVLGLFVKSVPRVFSLVLNTLSDFGTSVLKSGFIEDDKTPIRCGDPGVEFQPITISTIRFSLDHIKQIKANIHGVTVNDVITGVIFLGTRLYMKEMSPSSRNSQTTALVLLNTRDTGGYKTVKEMLKAKNNTNPTWGNQFCFLHVPVPKIRETAEKDEELNPVDFVLDAQKLIKRKRHSLAVHLTARLLESSRIYRGPEVTARYVHGTLKNSSMTISNMIGPVEQMSLGGCPVTSFYFMSLGSPQNLTTTVVSYNGELTVALGAERNQIDSQKLKSCIENAFTSCLQVFPACSFIDLDLNDSFSFWMKILCRHSMMLHAVSNQY